MADRWLPIASAPKDGTEVLTFDPAGVRRVDFYDSDVDAPWLGEPTHWMPLPAPPSGVDPANGTAGDRKSVAEARESGAVAKQEDAG